MKLQPRKVHPEQIKKIVAARLSDCFEGIPASQFYLIRQEADAFCLKQSWAADDEQAILIATFYCMLKDRYGDAILLDQTAFYQLVLHIELAAEFRNVDADPKKKVSSSHKALLRQIKKQMTANQLDVFEHSPLLLLHVIRKLFVRCLKQDVKDLYFLSREGKIVKALFDSYQVYMLGENTDNHQVKSHYLLVSRLATATASLSPLAAEDFQTLFRQYATLSIKQFAMSYGFDIETIALIGKTLSIDIDEIHEHFPSSSAFIKLKQHPDFMAHYEATRTTQRANFIDYFQTFSPAASDAPIFLFDVGWKGTIQDNLAKIFPDKKITGYYLGLLSPGTLTEPLQKQGLLFDYRNKDSNYWVYKENWPFFETLLSADHGYVKRYHRQPSGIIHVELANNETEQRIFYSKIAPLQQKMQAHFQQLILLFDNYWFGIQSTELYLRAKHQKKIFSPQKNETNWFFDIPFYENFGSFTHFDFSNCEAQSVAKKSKQLIIFLKSPKRYIASPLWPSARLTRNGLSMVVPLYKWYTLYFKRLLNR